MKKTLFLLMFVIGSLALLSPAVFSADDFLGAPLVPETKTLEKTDARLEMQAPLSHDRVLAFYREALKKHDDIKFRDWKDATYIEDNGKLRWHSITIAKGEKAQTQIVIVKDNWTWIVGTLILRFVAVFIVLLVLYVGMKVSGKIISHVTKKVSKVG